MAEALARAREMGNRRAQALCENALGAVQYLRGKWSESAAALERCIELSRSVGGSFGEVLGMQRLALVETGLGQYEAAHQRARQALGVALASDNSFVRYHSVNRLLATLAANRLAAGDLGQATEYLAQGFAAQEEAGECVTCDVLLYPVAVPIFISLGDLGQAEMVCHKAEAASAAFGSRTWMATARYLRGLLAAAQADWERAAACLEEAAADFQTLDQPLDLARCLDALGDVVARGGSGRSRLAAGELRQRAAELYRRLGAAEALDRGGVRPPKATASAARASRFS